MNRLAPALVLLAAACTAPGASAPNSQDVARWQQEAQRVTIIRDDWGIPHIYGKTDADAVFGMEYAQAEDDFNRVETNYINAIGRLAEAEGESAIYRDLRMKLFIDPDSMKALYATSPDWLKALMNAYADGLNFYLYRHPEVTPRVITHFEPWMALTFSEGSIGGDIERIDLAQLQDVLWQWAGDTGASRRLGAATGALGLQRDCDRSIEHRRSSRAAPHQSTHVVLLPRGAAGSERRGAQCLRRSHLGPILRVPGLQRPRWVDAHLQRRRRRGPLSGNRGEEGQPALLPLRRRRSAHDEPYDHDPVQDAHGNGLQGIHRVSDAARSDHREVWRQVDEHPA